MFKNINIFSDSQIALFGLRDYIYNWKYNLLFNWNKPSNFIERQ